MIAEYNRLKKELKSFKDPAKIKENQNKLFMDFLNQVPKFNICNPIPKQGDIKYVAILGETSSGKSTIYN